MNFKHYLLLIMAFIFSCTFNQGDTTPLSVTRVDIEGDTVVPWPELLFAFNSSVVDTESFLTIIPDNGIGYSSSFNIEKDTLSFKITGILNGNSSYLIKSNSDITAFNGTLLLKNDINFSFITYPMEVEPNNSFVNSDTLLGRTFGVVTPISDTDYYYINDSTISEIYMINHKGNSGFSVVTKSDSLIAVKTSLTDTLSLKFDLLTAEGLYLKLFTVLDNGSRYEIGFSR